MKQTTFFQTLIGLSALLLLSACEKDEEITTNLPQGFPAGCLLEKRSGDFFEFEYEFDDDGLLLTSGNSTYQRDGQGRVVRINSLTSSGELSFYSEYEYEGSSEIPSRVETYGIEDDGSEVSWGHDVVESEGNKVLSISSFSAAGELVETITYVYDDEASKYTIRRYGEDGASIGKEVYTYNPEMIHPYYSVWVFPAYANAYAPEKREEFDASGSIDVSRSYSVTYDIDENGRIINLKRVYLDGDTYNESLIYECE